MEAAIRGAARVNDKVALEMTTLLGDVRHQITKVGEYIMSEGKDPEGTFDIPTFEGTVSGEKTTKDEAAKAEDGFFVN